MPVNQALFLYIPLAALLLNAFLFLTCLSAKKNSLINTFLLLLLTFTAWTSGAFFMRLQLWPGVDFWYIVSTTGVFLTPIVYYLLIYHYTGQKGTFVKRMLQLLWAFVVIMNIYGVFINKPQVTYESGLMAFDYDATAWVILPIVLLCVTLFYAYRAVRSSIKEKGMPLSLFSPLIIGIAVLVFGMMNDIIPGLKSVPTDMLGCAINALMIYYALYKNRFISLTHITSESPTFLVSAIFTTVILGMSYTQIEGFYDRNFKSYKDYKTVVIAVVFSILTIIIYNFIRRLMSNLFVKSIETRDEELKNFSQSINKTLDLDEILGLFKQFIISNLETRNAFICIYDEAAKQYKAVEHTASMSDKMSFTLRTDNPLVVWLQNNNQSVLYQDFQRTNSYKSMWESEKKLLEDICVEMIFPIMSENKLTGITLFASKSRKRQYTSGEINYMESAAAIVSIAMKNASLYAKMQDESQRDSLTNLYNRRYFMQKVRQDFDVMQFDNMVLILLNFDDFRLYNELYGAHEGDYILKRFAEILQSVIKDEGSVARFGGKEFIISLPFYNAVRAQSVIMHIKERLQQCLTNIVDRGKRYLTFSAGVCEYPTSAINFEELLTYANMAVYTAKRNGKNRIEVYAQSALDESEQVLLDTENKKLIAENCGPTIFALTAAIDAKDHYTFNHSNNVSEYATILANAISLDSVHVEIIRQAGLMHDIGKIGIPDSILSKQSELTDEEYEIMKQHVEGSIAMIRHIPSLDYVIPAAIGHHERWDGKGYPRGLTAEEIPIGARCLCLADSFDAMTTKRPYREALSINEALDEIENSLGDQFDPKLGRVFINLVRTGSIKRPE